MFQNYNTNNVKLKHIITDNVVILNSMKGVSPVAFDNNIRNDCVLDSFPLDTSASACCSPKSSHSDTLLAKYAKAGYVISHFVEKFIDTDAGQIPVVRRKLDFKDKVQTVKARLGVTRNNYRVSQGLYAIGEPDENSEVLVTANFKLTFDILRTNINQLNLWILVLDTLGVNVWCAAGKGTFSTQELVKRVQLSGLEKIVKHRRLILPQLSATGVRAKDVKTMCGFNVIYGPVRASDIQAFLRNGRKAEPCMRRVTFTFKERLILTPIELTVAFKSLLITVAALLFISGVNSELFSLQNNLGSGLLKSLERGFFSLIFLFIGFVSGAVVTPALLPFLPFKAFAAKGIVSGAIFSLLAIFFSSTSSLNIAAMAALSTFGITVSSWFAMNFTGATPFTSPSGVEKEMKQFIPIQAGGAILSLVLWIYSAF
ncbi:MAG: hypothetical protein HQK70_01470 [Desulfamplus sp.]|nr:hypothetical protein [Desulfamplus sp.]